MQRDRVGCQSLDRRQWMLQDEHRITGVQINPHKVSTDLVKKHLELPRLQILVHLNGQLDLCVEHLRADGIQQAHHRFDVLLNRSWRQRRAIGSNQAANQGRA